MSQLLLFAPRFLEAHAGPNILHDPTTALVELVANAWDAGATRVDIDWPDGTQDRPFRIADNGNGMTAEQIQRRWLTLSYDRREEMGPYVQFPPDVEHPPRRLSFGRNGKGRHGMFAFGSSYVLRTWRDGLEVSRRICRGSEAPLKIDPLPDTHRLGHGTELRSESARSPEITAEQARAELGARFLTDPSFEVRVDGRRVAFGDIPAQQLERIQVEVEGIDPVEIVVLDTRDVDRTARLHGVAWHVQHRLVGRCSWDGTGHERFLDGRRSEAKRYTFIVNADGLESAVREDWSGFRSEDATFKRANEAVQATIREKLMELTRERRETVVQAVRDEHQGVVQRLTPLSRERWTTFVDQALASCPSLSDRELTQLAGVLAKLEESKSKYGLLSQLERLDALSLDDLHRILSEWTVDFAKVVLDELQGRLRLVHELQRKVNDPKTQEVQDLQPLFKQGLWIFGPEYETIEYTSNVGMTTVIQELFGIHASGSRNRPDFAILPDGTVGMYAYPRYDRDDAGEVGIDRLTIVELKKPGVPISTEQKAQAWKYVIELLEKGLVQDTTKVTCFVLGSRVNRHEAKERNENEGAVRIIPMIYDSVLARAKSRLLKLYERVRGAPFLNPEEVEAFLGEQPVDRNGQAQLFSGSITEAVAS